MKDEFTPIDVRIEELPVSKSLHTMLYVEFVNRVWRVAGMQVFMLLMLVLFKSSRVAIEGSLLAFQSSRMMWRN